MEADESGDGRGDSMTSIEITTRLPTFRVLYAEMLCIPEALASDAQIEEDFKGNCYAAATALAAILGPGARAVYGIWYGESVVRPGNPFHRHGWAEMDDKIIDPTRWVFEGKEPYYWIGPAESDEYDEGMAELREAVRRPPPEHDDTESQFEMQWSPRVKAFMRGLFDDDRDVTWLSFAEIFWLANTSMADEQAVDELYTQLIALDQGALIPIDFRNRWEWRKEHR